LNDATSRRLPSKSPTSLVDISISFVNSRDLPDLVAAYKGGQASIGLDKTMGLSVSASSDDVMVQLRSAHRIATEVDKRHGSPKRKQSAGVFDDILPGMHCRTGVRRRRRARDEA
jgi:hypothetical protein